MRTATTMAAARTVRGLAVAAIAAALSGLTGCVALLGPVLQPGQSERDVVAQLGMPTARYAMDQGVTRLEFATGPWGKHTWMVDVDASGRTVRNEQVLTLANLTEFQQRGPGMSRDELLRSLGRPAERRPGGLMGGELWSWRYATNECLWFQVSLSDEQRVTAGSFGIDWSCDHGDPKRGD